MNQQMFNKFTTNKEDKKETYKQPAVAQELKSETDEQEAISLPVLRLVDDYRPAAKA